MVALLEARKQRVGFLDRRFRSPLEAHEHALPPSASETRHGSVATTEAGLGARSSTCRGATSAPRCGYRRKIASSGRPCGEEACLADAVAAEHGETRARWHGKRQALDDPCRAITGREVDDFKRRCGIGVTSQIGLADFRIAGDIIRRTVEDDEVPAAKTTTRLAKRKTRSMSCSIIRIASWMAAGQAPVRCARFPWKARRRPARRARGFSGEAPWQAQSRSARCWP